jgi:DNA-binding transcriptional MerR regulator
MINLSLFDPDEPIYTIGAVAQKTGIPVTNLHAWERRYGFPESKRTPGGHRLYSNNEIQNLQIVKSQIDQGMQTRQAIQLVKQGRIRVSTQTLPQPPTIQQETLFSGSLMIPTHLKNFMEALLEQNIQRADQILGELIAFYTPEELSLQMIGPALYQTGEKWAQGEISVADEHFISNYLRHRLLMWMNTGSRPKPGPTIILACAPEEWHEGSLLMLGVLLSRQAWQVTYLGQNVPLPDLAACIHKYPPLAVVTVAMQPESAQAFSHWPDWIHQVSGKPIMAFGGKVFTNDPAWVSKIPGIYLGDTIQLGVDRLNSLLLDSQY